MSLYCKPVLWDSTLHLAIEFDPLLTQRAVILSEYW